MSPNSPPQVWIHSFIFHLHWLLHQGRGTQFALLFNPKLEQDGFMPFSRVLVWNEWNKINRFELCLPFHFSMLITISLTQGIFHHQPLSFVSRNGNEFCLSPIDNSNFCIRGRKKMESKSLIIFCFPSISLFVAL